VVRQGPRYWLRRFLTFASNLDRPALLDLALKTAIDAVQARAGRLSARPAPDEPLVEELRDGSLAGIEDVVYQAERAALDARGLGESESDGTWVVCVPLIPLEPSGRTHGLITVPRSGKPFSRTMIERCCVRSPPRRRWRSRTSISTSR